MKKREFIELGCESKAIIDPDIIMFAEKFGNGAVPCIEIILNFNPAISKLLTYSDISKRDQDLKYIRRYIRD